LVKVGVAQADGCILEYAVDVGTQPGILYGFVVFRVAVNR
jgi:hypothetical protein